LRSRDYDNAEGEDEDTNHRFAFFMQRYQPAPKATAAAARANQIFPKVSAIMSMPFVESLIF